MKNPLVTIGVLSYNNSGFILETLNSIKDQSYDNIELIIVDDFSNDDSTDKIEKWLRLNKDEFQSVRFLQNKSNQGICKTCNQIINISKGDFLCVFSSDDIMHSEKISTQIKYFSSSDENVGMICSDGFIVNEKGEQIDNTFWTFLGQNKLNEKKQIIFDQLVVKNQILAPSIMIKRNVFDVVGNYDESLSFEDYDMNLRISRKFKVMYYPDNLVYYRKHTSNLTSKIYFNYKEYFKIYSKHVDSNNRMPETKIHELINILFYSERDFLLKELKPFNFRSFFALIALKSRLPRRFFKFIFPPQ